MNPSVWRRSAGACSGGIEITGAISPGGERAIPWAVLLSELMLQRTRADLVVPVCEQVMRRYPTAPDLADAPSEEVEELLRPLGFLHRNARLQAGAQSCRAGVPRTMDGLLAVPGVGRYAATATLCFAYGRRMAVVDPSVIRSLARLEVFTSTKARPREDSALWAAAQELLPARGARQWNYAVLDHAALICQPRPRCRECPVLEVGRTGLAFVARDSGATPSRVLGGTTGQ